MGKKVLAFDRPPAKKRKTTLAAGQLTLHQAIRKQLKAAILPAPYTNPAHALWTLPHLVRAVLGELSNTKIVELLSLSGATLREGVALLYRQIDLSGVDAQYSSVGDAESGVDDETDTYTPASGDGSQEAERTKRRHLIRAAQHRQTVYRQAVRSILIPDTRDLYRLHELIGTFPRADRFFDGVRLLTLGHAARHTIPIMMFASDDYNQLPAKFLPAEWHVETVFRLTVDATVADIGSTIDAMRGRQGFFSSLVSLHLNVFVPHDTVRVYMEQSFALKDLRVLTDKNRTATRNLINSGALRLDRLIVAAEESPPTLTLTDMFDMNLGRRLIEFSIAIAPSSRSEVLELQVIARDLLPSDNRKLERAEIVVHDHDAASTLPAVSLLANWIRSVGVRAALTYSSAAGRFAIKDAIDAELDMMDHVHTATKGWRKL